MLRRSVAIVVLATAVLAISAQVVGADSIADHVVISEIQTAGGTADDEFIELYNPTSSEVDISSWSIQYRGGAGTTYYRKNFESGNSVPAYGFFLIAHSSYDGTVNPDGQGN